MGVRVSNIIIPSPFPLPRLSAGAITAVGSPLPGMIVYNTTTNKLNFYNGSAWAVVTSV